MFKFYQFVMVINSEKSSENNKVATLKATEQLIGETELLLFTEKFNTNFAVFCTEGKEEYSNGQEIVNYVVDNGINYNGIHYVPLMAGASAMRCAKFLMVDNTIKEELLSHIHWNINTSKNLSAAKESKYNALSMSVTYKWDVAFSDSAFYGVLKMPSIDKVVVCKDATSKVTAEVDEVDDNNVVRHDSTTEHKFTDGVNIYIVDDRGLTEKQRKTLVKKLDAWSFRAPGFKGLFVPVLYTAVVAFMKQNHWSGVFTDNWGVEHHILGVQCVCFNSSFKWSKCVDSWNQYVDGFKKNHHEFRVCVKAHNEKAAMPYQMFGMLNIDNSRLGYYTDYAAKYINELNENQNKLLGGSLRKAVEMLPELNKHFYVKQQKQIAYGSKRRQVIGGKVPAFGYNLFAAPDTMCVMQHIAGLELTGIAAEHIVCNKYEAGMKVCAMRSPHLDWAYCIRTAEEPAFGMHCGNTMYFSVHDMSMSIMQMDYDGDHVFVTSDSHFVDDASYTLKSMNVRPLEYKPMDEVKTDNSGEDAFKDILKTMVPAPIGLHALTIVKNVSEGIDKDVVRIQTRMANIIIDAATHGGRNTVGGKVDQQVDEYMTKNGKKHPLPIFHMFAKGKLTEDGVNLIPEKSVDSYAVHNNYILDKYAMTTMCATKSTITTNGTYNHDDFVHCVRAMTYGGKERVLEGTQEMYKNLVHARKDIFDTLTEDSKKLFTSDYAEFIRMSAKEYAISIGVSYERVVDSIITTNMGSIINGDDFDCMMCRLMWDAFGDEIVENIRASVNAEWSDIEDEEDTFEDMDLDID